MGSRVRKPETETIAISGGDTITVKKFLTAGEYRAVVDASIKPLRLDAAAGLNGQNFGVEINFTESGLATVLAYLLDWTFTDFDNRPVVIRDQPRAVVRAALDAIDAESYMEVQRAIQTHDKSIKAFMEAEKKMMSGPVTPDPTLRSAG